MKKYLIASALVLMLVSCSQYRYDITYEKCNGGTGSVQGVGDENQYPRLYSDSRYPTPELSFTDMNGGTSKKLGVCDFSYTKTLIQE